MLKLFRRILISNYLKKQTAIQLGDEVSIVRKITSIVKGCFDRLEIKELGSYIHIGAFEEYFKTVYASLLAQKFGDTIDYWRNKFEKNETVKSRFSSNAYQFINNTENTHGGFDLLSGVFDGSGLFIEEAIKEVKALVKKNGFVCVLVVTSDSPFPLLQIFSKSTKKIKSTNIKFQKSFLPSDCKQIRKILLKNNFSEIRVWEDGYAIQFKDDNEAFDFLMKNILGISGRDNMRTDIFAEMKEKFRNEIKSEFDAKQIYGICRFICCAGKIG